MCDLEPDLSLGTGEALEPRLSHPAGSGRTKKPRLQSKALATV